LAAAIGVNKLTGMNSAAMSSATHSAIEPTALHRCLREISCCILTITNRLCETSIGNWSGRPLPFSPSATG
jgi:hypothetical protein